MPKKSSLKNTNKMKKVMHQFKVGRLKIGKSNKKVKDQKQAIAIGLSKSRKKKKTT